MTYKEANELLQEYSGIIGKPLIDHKGAMLGEKKITYLLISPKEKIKEVFNAWWHNGNNNERAVLKLKGKYENFEVFIMSYDPSGDADIYYLRLKKYLELAH